MSTPRKTILWVVAVAKGCIGLIALAFCIVDLWRGDLTKALIVGALAAIVLGAARIFGNANAYASIRNRVVKHLYNAEYDAAAVVLNEVPGSAFSGVPGRDLLLMKAEIALQRGRLSDALGAVEEALAIKPRIIESLTAPDPCVEKEAEVLALGALVAALDKQLEVSRSMAHRAAALASVVPSTQARLALASCLALLKDGNDESFAAAVHQHRWLFEHLPPKERWLANRVIATRGAMERAYRSLDVDTSGADHLRNGWLQKVMPELAVMPADGVCTPTQDAPPPAQPAMNLRPLASMAVLLACIITVQWLPSLGGDDGEGLHSPMGLVVPLIIGAVVLFRFRQKACAPALRLAVREAQRLLGLGRYDQAQVALQTVVSSTSAWLRAEAMVLLAEHLLARGDFDTSLSMVQKVPPGPMLFMARASSMALQAERHAMLGNVDDARRALSDMRKVFFAFPQMPQAELRVQLLLAIKERDLPGAAALASQRSAELWLPLRYEVLCDLVEAAHKGRLPVPTGPLRSGIENNASLSAWLDLVDPGIRSHALAQHAQDAPSSA